MIWGPFVVGLGAFHVKPTLEVHLKTIGFTLRGHSFSMYMRKRSQVKVYAYIKGGMGLTHLSIHEK